MRGSGGVIEPGVRSAHARRFASIRRLVAVVGLAGGLLAAALVIVHRGAWGALGVPVGPRSWGDLRQLTASAACAREIPGWDHGSLTCDPFGRPYNYPLIWARAFGALGASESDTEWLGVVLVILLAACLLVVLLWASPGGAQWLPLLLVAVAACSPPVRLLIERGNIDLIVFAVLVLLVAVVCSRLGPLALPVLVLAVVLKLYPVGAAPALLLLRRFRRRSVALFAVSIGFVLVSLAPELPAISGGTPQTWDVSYGVSALPLALADHGLGWFGGAPLAIGLCGLVASCAALLLVLRTARRSRIGAAWDAVVRAVVVDRTAAALVLVGGGAFVVSYCVGTSFDYRLVLLLLPLAGLLRARPGARGCLVIAVLILLVLWTGYPLKEHQELGNVLLAALTTVMILFGAAACRRLVRAERLHAPAGAASASLDPHSRG